MSKNLREISQKVIRTIKLIEAGCHLVPLFLNPIAFLMVVSYLGMNIFSITIGALLLVHAMASFTAACEVYANMPPLPAPDDRRRFLGNSALTNRSGHRDERTVRKRQDFQR